MTRRIHLTIDRLVLHEVPPDQRGAVTAALTAELERQLADADLSGSRSLAAVRAAPVRAAAGPALGVQAARSIAAALKR